MVSAHNKFSTTAIKVFSFTFYVLQISLCKIKAILLGFLSVHQMRTERVKIVSPCGLCLLSAFIKENRSFRAFFRGNAYNVERHAAILGLIILLFKDDYHSFEEFIIEDISHDFHCTDFLRSENCLRKFWMKCNLIRNHIWTIFLSSFCIFITPIVIALKPLHNIWTHPQEHYNIDGETPEICNCCSIYISLLQTISTQALIMRSLIKRVTSSRNFQFDDQHLILHHGRSAKRWRRRQQADSLNNNKVRSAY